MTIKETKIYETDLYAPIQTYFANQGYTVQAEVNDCDVTATKGEKLVIVELKLTLNMALLIQATKRQRITEFVYIAIPYPTYSLRSRKWKDLCHLLRRLELGLITVSFRPSDVQMEIIHEPGAFDRKRSMRQSKKRRNHLLQEIAGRRGNYNVGGSHQTKIHTAYKENSIHIACCLERFGPLSPKSLREMGTGDKTYSILQKNHYEWFERTQRGIYGITEKGLVELKESPEMAEIYYTLVPEK